MQLKDCESIIKILESEIASKSPAIEAHRQTTSANIEALTGTMCILCERKLVTYSISMSNLYLAEAIKGLVLCRQL